MEVVVAVVVAGGSWEVRRPEVRERRERAVRRERKQEREGEQEGEVDGGLGGLGGGGRRW